MFSTIIWFRVQSSHSLRKLTLLCGCGHYRQTSKNAVIINIIRAILPLCEPTGR